jgi:hypothetical protein
VHTTNLVSNEKNFMSVNDFAEWLQRQGYKVFKTKSSYWFEVSPLIFQAFPYHWVIQPDEKELNDLFREQKGLGLRYSVSINHPEGVISYHVVYREQSMELSSLSKKARYDIRQGLDYAEIKQISFEQMAHEGWSLRKETLQRQGRKTAENEDFWKKLCQSAKGLDGFEAWGAIHHGQLVASVLCFIIDDCCSILYQQSITDHLSHGINNTIAFSVSNDMLMRPNVQQIFYGLQSLDAPPSVDSFKFRMGYIAQPVRQRVVFNPQIAPLFNNITYAGIKTASHLLPGNPTLAKSEGMLRFYLQGKRPLAEQDWPEVLLEQKETILAQMNQT